MYQAILKRGVKGSEVAAASLLRFLAKHYAGVILTVVVIGLFCSLASSLSQVNYYGSADEGYYAWYVREIAASGPARFPSLFRTYTGNAEHWVFPSPLRIGYIVTAALFARLISPSFALLSYVSLCSHLALIVSFYLFLKRRIGNPTALLASLLTACSPLLLGLSRRALTDSYATLWMGLAIMQFHEASRQNDRRSVMWFGVAYACAILVKETAVLFAAPLLAYGVIGAVRHQWRWNRALVMTLALLSSGLACGGVYLCATGGLAPFLATVRIILASPGTNAYATGYCSGPWYRYLLDFLLLSPYVTVLALAFLVESRMGTRCRAGGFLAVLSTILLVIPVVEFSFLAKNVRYLAFLELPMRLSAVLVMDGWLSGLDARRRFFLLACLVCGLCWQDGRTYDAVFLKGQVYDPVSFNLLRVRRIIP